MSVSLVIVVALSTSAALVGMRILQKGMVAHRHTRAVDRRLAMLASESNTESLQELSAFEIAVRGLARLSLLISRDLPSQSRLIREAGIFAHGAVRRYLALRIALPAVVAPICLAFSTTVGLPPERAAVFTAGLVLIGYFGPALVLRRLAGLRRRRVFCELPFFLDSVKLLLQSGASLELALRQIARMDTAAIPEIRRTLPYLLEDLDQGKSYDLAFDRWVEKLAAPDAEELVGLMLQSVRHGTELTPMLEQFIQEQIERRLANARETAGKRSVSLTVIMVAFFLPPLMAIMGAPAVIDIARTILR